MRGRALSLFVCICKGEYDEILEWPFGHEITLTLVDQNADPKQARDIVYRVHPNPSSTNLQFLGRPIGERNARCAIATNCKYSIEYNEYNASVQRVRSFDRSYYHRSVIELVRSFGAQRLIDLEVLHTLDYVKDNIIYFKVNIDLDNMIAV